MSAAAFRAPLPLYQEGLAFWEEFTKECQRLTAAINAVALDHGLHSGHQVEWIPGRTVSMLRRMYPSTQANAALSFEHWGPLIKLSITGHQHEDLRYYPEELDVPLGRDLDGQTVAIFGEGRSFTAHNLACYLAQSFRRCFPEMALPCASCT